MPSQVSRETTADLFAGHPRRASALGCCRPPGAAAVRRAQSLQDHRARRHHGGDVDFGGGEWLVGPAAAVKYSSAIFLIATVAILLQVIFNLEAIRYTLYTGEPIYGGIMRLKPGPKFWAAFYTVIGFFQLGWPALAGQRRGDAPRGVDGTHARCARSGARRPGSPSGLILFVVLILSFGGTIERMLEYFAWTMLGVVFLFLLAINIAFVPMSHWGETFAGVLQLHRPATAHRLGRSSARSPRPPVRAASAT